MTDHTDLSIKPEPQNNDNSHTLLICKGSNMSDVTPKKFKSQLQLQKKLW